MNPLSDFINGAKGLAKNPLGIVALFISMIYGFACIVLSTSISNLTSPSERLPLIWFIILFPIVTLGAFVFLVVKHHEKLYAPSDFRNDEAFIETMNRQQIEQKQAEEVDLLEKAKQLDDNDLNTRNEISASEISRTPKMETDTELLDSNVEEMGDDTTNEPRTLSKEELVQRYSDSEKWGVKELGLKYNVHFRTNQKLNIDGRNIELDAYAANPAKIIIAEIKYWQSDRSIKPLLFALQEFMRKYDSVNKVLGKGREITPAVLLVFDNLSKINTEEILSFIRRINERADVEFRDYHTLEQEYA